MSRYLDVVNRVAQSYAHAKSAKTAKSDPASARQFSQVSQFSHSHKVLTGLEALQSRCPTLIELSDWKLAISDGSAFLSRWGDQSAALGWSAEDLFGLPPVPVRPSPTFRRLARYDLMGLVWLLRGRPVMALTQSTAVIKTPNSGVTVYRKPPVRPFKDVD